MSHQSKLLVILGMHRSGTSLTARWLKECGLQMFDLIGPDVGNEDGHFEDEQIVKLQSDIIKSNLPASKGWIVRYPFFRKISIKGFEERFIKYLRDRNLQSTSVWGWKDPRTCLLISQWIEIEKNLKVLVIYRPALNIISSLLSRSKKSKSPVLKINFFHAFTTTYFYQKQVVNFYKNNPEKCLLLSIDNIIDSNRQSFELINNFLNGSLKYSDIVKFLKKKSLNKSNHPIPFTIKLLFYCSPLRKIDSEFRSMAISIYK